MSTDKEWSRYTDDTLDGELTGDAKHARECRATPLEAKAILDLLCRNLGYFGDRYYEPLTRPVEMRVDEFYASLD